MFELHGLYMTMLWPILARDLNISRLEKELAVGITAETRPHLSYWAADIPSTA